MVPVYWDEKLSQSSMLSSEVLTQLLKSHVFLSFYGCLSIKTKIWTPGKNAVVLSLPLVQGLGPSYCLDVYSVHCPAILPDDLVSLALINILYGDTLGHANISFFSPV